MKITCVVKCDCYFSPYKELNLQVTERRNVTLTNEQRLVFGSDPDEQYNQPFVFANSGVVTCEVLTIYVKVNFYQPGIRMYLAATKITLHFFVCLSVCLSVCFETITYMYMKFKS